MMRRNKFENQLRMFWRITQGLKGRNIRCETSKHVLFLVIIFFITSCTPEDKKVPKDILPIDKMKLIVWDLTQAGTYATILSEKDTTKRKIGAVYLAEVLKLHSISKPDFFKSFDFYQTHPLLNQQLFDSVNAYAQRQRNEIYKKMR